MSDTRVGGGNVPSYVPSPLLGGEEGSEVKDTKGVKDPEALLPPGTPIFDDSAGSKGDLVALRLFDSTDIDLTNLSDEALQAYIFQNAFTFSETQILIRKTGRELYQAKLEQVHQTQLKSAEKLKEGAEKLVKAAIGSLAASLVIGGGSILYGLNTTRNANNVANDNKFLRKLENDLSLKNVDQDKADALKQLQNKHSKTTGDIKFTDDDDKILKNAKFSDDEIKLYKDKLNTATDRSKAFEADIKQFDAAEAAKQRDKVLDVFRQIGEDAEKKSPAQVAKSLSKDPVNGDGELRKGLKDAGFTDDQVDKYENFFNKQSIIPFNRSGLFTPDKTTSQSAWDETLTAFRGRGKTETNYALAKENLTKAEDLRAPLAAERKVLEDKQVALESKRLTQGGTLNDADTRELESIKTDLAQKNKQLEKLDGEILNHKLQVEQGRKARVNAADTENSRIDARQGFSETQTEKLRKVASKDILVQAILNFSSIGNQFFQIFEQKVQAEEVYQSKLLDADATKDQAVQANFAELTSGAGALISEGFKLADSGIAIINAEASYFNK